MMTTHLIHNDTVEPQTVFAELLQLAQPVVEHYHSDLYHDAIWLKDNLPNLMDDGFYFGIRTHGTHIGTDRRLIQNYNAVTFHITFARTDSLLHPWTMTITKVK